MEVDRLGEVRRWLGVVGAEGDGSWGWQREMVLGGEVVSSVLASVFSLFVIVPRGAIAFFNKKCTST